MIRARLRPSNAHHQPLVKCLKMSRRYHGTVSAAVYTQARTRLRPGSVGTVCSVRYARPCKEQCMHCWYSQHYPKPYLTEEVLQGAAHASPQMPHSMACKGSHTGAPLDGDRAWIAAF